MFKDKALLELALKISAENAAYMEAHKKRTLAKDMQAGAVVNNRVVSRVFVLGDNVEITWQDGKISHHHATEESF